MAVVFGGLVENALKHIEKSIFSILKKNIFLTKILFLLEPTTVSSNIATIRLQDFLKTRVLTTIEFRSFCARSQRPILKTVDVTGSQR